MQSLLVRKNTTVVTKKGKAESFFQKPDKIVLENTNFSYALGKHPNEGTVRETFLANQMSNANYDLILAQQGDFLVDNQYTLEVGGKNKTHKQLKDVTDGWVVRDNTEVGYGTVVPLWLFGFLY